MNFLTRLSALILCLMPCSTLCFADQANVEKVGGTYIISEIEQKNDGSFLINFENKTKTGKFDFLQLNSDHIHHQLNVGQELRISAEVVQVRKNKAEISQVLLFLPQDQTVVPVWLLSKKAQPSDLNATKYIEMHAPQNDFQIF